MSAATEPIRDGATAVIASEKMLNAVVSGASRATRTTARSSSQKSSGKRASSNKRSGARRNS